MKSCITLLIHCLFHMLWFLAQDCNVLPNSANQGYEKGCKGAVYRGGKPSEDYCNNVAGANGRYPWYKECCKWENEECIPKVWTSNIEILYPNVHLFVLFSYS